MGTIMHARTHCIYTNLADRNSESDSVTNEDSSDNTIGPSNHLTLNSTNATPTNNHHHHHNNTTTDHHEATNSLNHLSSVTPTSAMSSGGLNKNAGKNQLQMSETLIAGGLGRNLPKKK